ncbi:hypothetical protein C7C46_05215 [Streptomyces tateyamensis]|uniref:Acyl-CoA dehydrogenase/oxidase C-terminal domain-containing protein n=1 Tax=Streptomyces tateyamensis TaxID=565073 RepID=A0A2V4NP99_9ACTN|nr:acyl-CoA/acyl-ACP dehydrogenase [Streptomyces tateyamensis]PYC87367.1 hypothetical protein C7C46_05215 [Streptomyces tateyamensis]
MTATLSRTADRLGDPADAANPLGFAALVAADERGELPAVQLGFTPELVRALGGRDLGLVLGRALAPALSGLPRPAGYAFLREEPLRARPVDGALLLDGQVHATGPGALLLTVELAGTARYLLLPAELRPPAGPFYRTPGLRGCRPHRLAFTGHRVPADALLPGPADPARAARLLAGATLGALDTQLRTTLRFAEQRELYGRPVTALPSARAALAEAFTDLLIADCCLARGTAATVEQLVPVLVREAGHRLALLLGARSYLREGEHAIFQKHQRDLTTLAALRGPLHQPGARLAEQAAQACRLVQQQSADPFRSAPHWLAAALHRLAGLGDPTARAPHPHDLPPNDSPAARAERDQLLLDELRRRQRPATSPS